MAQPPHDSHGDRRQEIVVEDPEVDDSTSDSDNGTETQPQRVAAENGDDSSGDDAEVSDADSDTETQRIGESVHRYVSRCVKTGDFSKAMTALMTVIEISDMDSTSCCQALLSTAQIFSITGQLDQAMTMMMEIWPRMPEPYTTRDAQLFISSLYDSNGQSKAAAFWYRRALGGETQSLTSSFQVWLALAEKAFDQCDFILSSTAYAHVLGYLSHLEEWPEVDITLFRFIGRYLTALTSVAYPRPDIQMFRQSIAFRLAMALQFSWEEGDFPPIQERVWDPAYLLVRSVYSSSFPALYQYLFQDEDRFVGRISRAWRVYRARRARRRAIAERERERAEIAAQTPEIAPRKRKKKIKKAATKPPPKEADDDDLRLIRCKTKARIQSLRSPPQPKARRSSPKPTPKPEQEPDRPPMIVSPTRRKFEAVKKLRHDAPLEPPDPLPRPTSPDDERPRSSESSTTLLDLYTFPPLAAHREQFNYEAGRSHGPADLDNELEEIEAFARMAHYRSRVIGQAKTIQPLSQLKIDNVTPEWLRQINEVIKFTQDRLRDTSTLATSTLRSYFSEIQARVVFQLTRVHQKYVLQHGKTMFTIKLDQLIKRVQIWQFHNVEQDFVRELVAARTIGEGEEAHRNLEFYHVLHSTST